MKLQLQEIGVHWYSLQFFAFAAAAAASSDSAPTQQHGEGLKRELAPAVRAGWVALHTGDSMTLQQINASSVN